MGKNQNIVHEYYQKELEGFRILVRVNPITYEGTELTIMRDGETSVRHLQFDEEIKDDLEADGFVPGSPMEFNLLLSGISPGSP